MDALTTVLQTYQAGPDTGIFTDGACKGNPGVGGWGMVVVINGEIVTYDYGGLPHTTNNQMEYHALIAGLKAVESPESFPDNKVVLYTDSHLLVQSLTKWVFGWKAKGWKKSGGPIKNLELVQEAHALCLAKPWIELQWVKGHAGFRWNEYADALANMGITSR